MGVAPTGAEVKDLFWRSVWTFLQAGIGTATGLPLASSLGVGGLDLDALQTISVAAVVAGVAAVLSVVKTYSSNKLGTGAAEAEAIGERVIEGGGVP
jgi:hypothetical protein